MKPVISIIIPVYNVEQYLRKCLESVLNQSFTNIEIICIDDGSTDHCPEILDEYAQNDNRIIVIHKKNEGYGKAINYGISLACGDYIGIVESDDYILPEMYEVLYYNICDEPEVDFVKSDYYLLYENEIMRFHSHACDYYYDCILSTNERVNMFNFSIYIWTGLYRRKFLKDNQIDCNETPGASFQDQGFWFKTMMMCNKAKWLNKAFYVYRQDNPSSSVKVKDKMFVMSNEYDLIYTYLQKKGLTDTYYMYYIYYRMLKNISTFLRIDDSLKGEFIDFVKSDCKEIKLTNCGFTEYNYVINWLDRIRSDSQKYITEYLLEKERMMNCIKNTNNIYLYGAGIRAFKVYLFLKLLGLENKIRGVVVSDKIDKDTLFGVKVNKLDKLRHSRRFLDSFIIISVKEGTKSYEEIKSNLVNIGCENYNSSSIFLDV